MEEYLYSAMEDYRIDIMIDKGPSARSIQLDLNPFTLVGATTRSGLLTAPLRARFGINLHLEYYDAEVRFSASWNVRRTSFPYPSSTMPPWRLPGAAVERPVSPMRFCAACAILPRCAARDGSDMAIARYALEALNIDRYGLDEIDNKILLTIIDKFKGGPVGITTIATAIGEDARDGGRGV